MGGLSGAWGSDRLHAAGGEGHRACVQGWQPCRLRCFVGCFARRCTDQGCAGTILTESMPVPYKWWVCWYCTDPGHACTILIQGVAASILTEGVVVPGGGVSAAGRGPGHGRCQSVRASEEEEKGRREGEKGRREGEKREWRGEHRALESEEVVGGRGEGEG
eukprot:1411229-Rhodomonas_salina.4